MILQESIKKILRETVNESTFFRRRVDMDLMEKEFFENLNYVTSIFLEKYNEGKGFNMYHFETVVLNHLMNNYNDELSNGGLNDFPYDKIQEFLSNHFHDKIKDRYDTMFGNKINESVDKSEEKKLKLVTRMIHEFFDEVSFIDIKKYENKPMIRVYFDNDEYAANEETYFAEQIQRKIYEYTGIKLVPYWHTIQYNTDADFRLDAIKLKYDGEGNVINESEENKKEKKFNRLIQNVEDYLNSNEYPSVKRFTVYYEDTHDDVIVNIFFDAEEAVKLGGGINSVIKKVGKQVMSDLELFPLYFKYYTHFDKGINESEEKQPKYLNIIKELIEPFKKEDCVCDIKVTFEHDMYMIYLVFGQEELNDLFFSFVGRADYGRNLRNDVKNAIKAYLPIDNLYVGSISKLNCEWKPMNESENKKQSLIELISEYGLYDFINMSGLDVSQISSELKNMNNPKEVLKQYIRDFVLINGYKWGDNSGILSGYEIQLSNDKYVDDIEVIDVDLMSVKIWVYDEYGHKEKKTSINALTDDELLTIIDWMTKTIKNGDWD